MTDPYSYKMKLFVVGCVFLTYFIHVLFANEKGCSFYLHNKSEKNSPILLYNDTSFVLPKHGEVHLKKRQVVNVICPDPHNYILTAQTNISSAQCIQSDILRLSDQDISFEKLQCKRVIKGTVLETTRKCGNNEGFIYRIGYPISTRLFITIITICFDKINTRTLYAEHLLHGEEIKYASKTSYRPPFSPDGIQDAVSIAYKQSYAKSKFNQILKSAKEAQKYINKHSYLSRGHLAPDADFLLAPLQYSTYYYLNAVPQWQSINVANWKRLENKIRKVGDKRQETLLIITGTHEVLSLPDLNGNSVNVFLIDENRLPVPKYIWKIVYSKKTKQAIVLVSVNNPFKSMDNRDFLCEDICGRVGWSLAVWKQIEKGFVFCCNYEEFAHAVATAPKLAVDGVLHGPG